MNRKRRRETKRKRRRETKRKRRRRRLLDTYIMLFTCLSNVCCFTENQVPSSPSPSLYSGIE